MSIYSAIPLFVAIYAIILGIFVYANNRKSPIHTSFGLVCIGGFMWLAGAAAMFLSPSAELAIKWSRFLFLGVIAIPAGYHHFTMRFLKKEDQGRNISIVYLISAVFAFTIIFGNSFIKGITRPYWRYQTSAGYLHSIYLVFILIVSPDVYIACMQGIRKI